MMAYIFDGRILAKQISGMVVMVLCISLMAIIGAGDKAQAALLDGLLTGVEEALAERVISKGEPLKLGNFYTVEQPNAHGPIGIMGDHTHDQGEVMFSYRYMHMFMEGTRNGTTRITNAQARALGAFPVVPESMRMEMHMFGAMYGVNDTMTVFAMVPYIRKSMNHTAGATLGTVKFATRSEGIGDIRTGTLMWLWAVEVPSIGAHRFHFNLAVSFPTGNIEPTDQVANGQTIRLPYPMHLGSGTVDFYPGLTYGGTMERVTWGFQAVGTLRGGRNGNNFSKGDAAELNVYGAYEFIPKWLGGFVRFDYMRWHDYNGADSMINEAVVQTAVPSRLGGERLDLLGGFNLLLPEFMGFETRLAMEGGVPIYQWLQGQLETDAIVIFGLQGIY